MQVVNFILKLRNHCIYKWFGPTNTGQKEVLNFKATFTVLVCLGKRSYNINLEFKTHDWNKIVPSRFVNLIMVYVIFVVLTNIKFEQRNIDTKQQNLIKLTNLATI